MAFFVSLKQKKEVYYFSSSRNHANLEFELEVLVFCSSCSLEWAQNAILRYL